MFLQNNNIIITVRVLSILSMLSVSMLSGQTLPAYCDVLKLVAQTFSAEKVARDPRNTVRTTKTETF